MAHQPGVVELPVGQLVEGAAGEGVKIRKPFRFGVFGQHAFGHAEKIVQVKAVAGEFAFLSVRSAGDDDGTRHDLKTEVDFLVGAPVAALFQFLAHPM